MKTKFQINQQVNTPDGQGIIIELEPGWGEHRVRLEDGTEVYVHEELLTSIPTLGGRGKGPKEV